MGGWVWSPKGKAKFPSLPTFSYHIWQIGRAQITKFEPSVGRGRGVPREKSPEHLFSGTPAFSAPEMYQIDVCLVVNTECALGPVKAFYNTTLSKLVPRQERTNVLELNLYPKQRKSGLVEKEMGFGEQQ